MPLLAQLRDAETSELIAEGTPLEVAVAGKKIGFREVLFDNVGAGFDATAVIKAHEEQIEGLDRAAKEEDEAEFADAAKARADELRAQQKRASGKLATDAQKALEAARDRVEG